MDQYRGEAFVVVAHAHDVAGGPGGDAARWFEAGDHGALRRIHSDQEPHDDVVDRHERQPNERDAGRWIGEQHGLCTVDKCRLAHESLWKRCHNGQALAESERLGRLKTRATLIVQRRDEVGGLGSLRAGVALHANLIHGDARWQRDRSAGLLDGKVPAIAGDVPVEFVVVLKESELPAGLVGQLVAILAGRQHHALLADIDSRAVR